MNLLERIWMAGVQRLKFVRNHHCKIDRVAAVADSGFLKIVPRIAEHFAYPEIRAFSGAERAAALAWLQTGSGA